MAGKSEQVAVYELRVKLLDVAPEVWRRVLVPRDITLENLHLVVQRAMGWDNEHLHEFQIGRKRYSRPNPNHLGLGEPPVNESIVRLNGVAKPNAKFRYQYDFGDEWIHEVAIEREIQSESNERKAICTEGENSCPPEDCGGAYGYANMLEILRDTQHEEYSHMREWLGEEFDPRNFDMQLANHGLAALKV